MFHFLISVFILKFSQVPTQVGFPGGSVVKTPPANAGDVGLIPGSGRSLEKEMPTHSSILAWKIPWTEEPGRLQFMGLQRVGHDWATKQRLIQVNIASVVAYRRSINLDKEQPRKVDVFLITVLGLFLLIFMSVYYFRHYSSPPHLPNTHIHVHTHAHTPTRRFLLCYHFGIHVINTFPLISLLREMQ